MVRSSRYQRTADRHKGPGVRVNRRQIPPGRLARPPARRPPAARPSPARPGHRPVGPRVNRRQIPRDGWPAPRPGAPRLPGPARGTELGVPPGANPRFLDVAAGLRRGPVNPLVLLSAPDDAVLLGLDHPIVCWRPRRDPRDHGAAVDDDDQQFHHFDLGANPGGGGFQPTMGRNRCSTDTTRNEQVLLIRRPRSSRGGPGLAGRRASR